MNNFKFGRRSNSSINSSHPAWTEILTPVLEVMDIAVVCGHRNKAKQDEAFFSGRSQKMWPDSNHNQLPSLAVDVLPPPYDYKDVEMFCVLWGLIWSSANALGYTVRWGGDWDSDGSTLDETFRDYGHFELMNNGVK